MANRKARKMPMQRSSFKVAAIAVVIAMAFSVSPRAEAQSVAGRVVGLQRTTLVVSDIEKTLDFYQRAGLTKVSDTSATDAEGVFGAVDLPLTADPKRSRLVLLRGSDERAGLLALLWYDRPPLPSARGNLVGIGSGDVIIGIEVGDIQAAYGRLNQIGTRFQRMPVRFSQPGPDGLTQSGQHMLAYDPDGHMVQIIQSDRR
jgi:catechol 2,3-dioxygenase-like lactoylglutathione lyase family enzyme